MKKYIVLIILLCINIYAYSQNNPRIAVLPFEAKNTSSVDADIVTSLFETGLVKTNVYNVIEKNQIKQILDAQAFSLSGCTDESCAVEVGQLLSAEQIIIGSLSKIGSKYIIAAKIIDVEKGQNLRAENIEADSLDDMLEKAATLAYMLAGLAYQSGGSWQIAADFGELYVSTDPAGADIYINGMKKGISPNVISKIPFGTVLVEARNGNLYASENVKVDKEIREIFLTLSKVLGSLFIRSSQSAMDVWLNGQSLGALKSGLYKELAVGGHKLELKGEGLYWSGDIELTEGGTTKVEADPWFVGELIYNLPEGVMAQIEGWNGFSASINNSGTLKNMRTGDYSVIITGSVYKPLEESISIEQSVTRKYTPNLEYSDEYLEEQQLAEWKGSITKYDVLLSDNILDSELNDLKALITEMNESSIQNDSLLEKAQVLFRDSTNRVRLQKEQALQDQLEVLIVQREKAIKSGKTGRIIRWSSLGTGVVSFAVIGVGLFLGEQAYTDYKAAIYTDQISDLRADVQLWNTVAISGGIIGGLAVATGLVSMVVKSDPTKFDLEITRVSRELAELKGGLE